MKIKRFSYLPTLFFFRPLAETQLFFLGLTIVIKTKLVHVVSRLIYKEYNNNDNINYNNNLTLNFLFNTKGCHKSGSGVFALNMYLRVLNIKIACFNIHIMLF